MRPSNSKAHRAAAAHGNLGILLAKRGDMDGAVEQFREAVRLNPGSIGAANNLRIALQEQSDRRCGKKPMPRGKSAMPHAP